ncbi:GNAT family N-acetyltransferase [Lentibacillus salinarum]|uniref:GNAT family N-acetyltransferase n=1 Tax=Lentibacillus salinarum TaxID=446820 RepID=A0ABW3ZYH6_9BACI
MYLDKAILFGGDKMDDSIQDTFESVRTENLFLRIPKEEDLHSVFSIEGNPATNKYRPAGPTKDINEAKETLKEWRNNWEIYGYGYWTVILPSSSEIIGFGGIRRESWKNRNILNLYYRFSPRAWGRGYATEVAGTAVKMADVYLPNLPVVARIRSINKPSIRVAERVGLQHCSELDSTEHMVFTLKKGF